MKRNGPSPTLQDETENPPVKFQEIISTEILNFFQRIQNIVTANKFPNELYPFILPLDLEKIYDYILKNQEQLQNLLTHNASLRLPKEETGLKRTLNIIQDPSANELALILETKHKTSSGAKDKINIPTFKGKTKKGVPAWRLDSEKPQKWINLVVSQNFNEKIQGELDKANQVMRKIKNEINIPKDMNIKGASIAQELGHPLFQVYSLSEPFTKPSQSADVKTLKISLYSPCAIGTLKDIIKNIKQNGLTEEDKYDITLSLLKELKVLHKNGINHQDIKSQNILVYKKENGKYYAKIADFGLAKANTAGGTYGYESPEISLAHNCISDRIYTYFHLNEVLSYGKYFCDQFKSIKGRLGYLVPHASNDMWALGMVLCELYAEKSPLYVGANPQVNQTKVDNLQYLQILEENITKNPLLAGLLSPQREKRFSAEQAIEIFEKHNPKPKI